MVLHHCAKGLIESCNYDIQKIFSGINLINTSSTNLHLMDTNEVNKSLNYAFRIQNIPISFIFRFYLIHNDKFLKLIVPI